MLPHPSDRGKKGTVTTQHKNTKQIVRRMVQALWPVLWGHWMTELWQLDEEAYRVGAWMMQHFCPEGPLMPLRIGDQPYGLLPVTALSQWRTPSAFTPETQAQAQVEIGVVAKYRIAEAGNHVSR